MIFIQRVVNFGSCISRRFFCHHTDVVLVTELKLSLDVDVPFSIKFESEPVQTIERDHLAIWHLDKVTGDKSPAGSIYVDFYTTRLDVVMLLISDDGHEEKWEIGHFPPHRDDFKIYNQKAPGGLFGDLEVVTGRGSRSDLEITLKLRSAGGMS